MTKSDVAAVPEAVVLTVTGALDILTAPSFEQALRETLALRPKGVVIDLTGLEFLASAGLAALVEGHRIAGSITEFAVVAVGPATRRPLQLTGLTDVFGVFATLEEAVAKFAE